MSSDSFLYTGWADGKITKFTLDGKKISDFANTGGRPLGLQFDKKNNLIVADEYKSLGVVIFAHVLVDIVFLLLEYFVGIEDAGSSSGVAVIVFPLILFIISLFCLLYKNEGISKLFRKKRLVING